MHARTVVRSMRWFGVGLLALVAVLVLALAVWVKRPIPALSGDTHIHALSAQVEIVRDAHAIPHIYAKSVADAYVGLGYVHAQDRLWQLEFNRRVASGELAELIGERGLDMDRLFRSLDLEHVSERTYAALDAETQSVLVAYTRGINAYIAEGHPLPLEFQLLRCTPRAYRPADAVLFIKLLAWQLSGNWFDELERVRLGAQLSAAELAEFSPPYAGSEPIPFAQLWQTYDDLGLGTARAAHSQPNEQHTFNDAGAPHGPAWLRELAPLAAELAVFAPAELGQAIGSNNWVVDGSRSSTHKPLLANDPHLALNAPSQWYLAHLEAPGLSVIGATLPAAAGVILGRNAHVAWAFTNTHPDTEDVFVERMLPGDDSQYLTPDGPKPFERRRALIKVKGAPDVEHWVRSTRHGPVLSDVSDHAQGLAPAGHVLALSWTGLSADDHTAAFPLRAARAGNAEELRAAAGNFHAPTQNIVYADDAGAVGFVAAGKVPVRGPDNTLKGLVPAPGWSAAYDWTGVLPFDELPQTTAPTNGRIVTANQNILPEGYTHWIGGDWGPPYRHDRIVELLDAQPEHTLQSFAAIQHDQKSRVAELMVPALLTALGMPRDDDERTVVAELEHWDHEMRPHAAAPLLFAAWLRELSRVVYADELGKQFSEEAWARPEFLQAVLLDHAGQARWCDDKRSVELEDCAHATREALHAALAYLNKRFGSDRNKWSWGTAHPGVSGHALLGKVPVLARFFDVAAVRGGDSSTVDVGSYKVDDDEIAFRNAWGPGFRALYDLADLEHSVAILNTGESGHAASPHYGDMNVLWAKGEYVPLITERTRVAQGALGTWHLRP